MLSVFKCSELNTSFHAKLPVHGLLYPFMFFLCPSIELSFAICWLLGHSITSCVIGVETEARAEMCCSLGHTAACWQDRHPNSRTSTSSLGPPPLKPGGLRMLRSSVPVQRLGARGSCPKKIEISGSLKNRLLQGPGGLKTAPMPLVHVWPV